MNSPEVVVVGAGVAGCATAYAILDLDPTARVLLVDEHHLGAGSTSRSTAAFRHQWSVPAHVAFSRYAAGEIDRLAALGYPVGFRRNGYLFLYRDPAALEEAARRADRQRELGVEGVEVLRPDDLGRVPGGDRIRKDDLAGAVWGPADGFLDPLALAGAYLDQARGRGVVYRPGCKVVEILEAGDVVTGVRLEPGGTTAAGSVVLAGGAWTPSLAALLGLPLPVVPVKRYLYHSRPLRGFGVGDWPLLIADGGAHTRPSEGNTLMMGWERRPRTPDRAPPAGELWERQDAIEPGFGLGVEDYGLEVLAALASHVPALADEVALARATCGWYAMTPDHKAILSPDPRRKGLFHAVGFSGHGIMHGPATGRVMAELVLGWAPSLLPARDLDRQFGLAPLLEGRIREPVEDMVL